MTTYPKPHIFGIRHHGPGSARSLLQALRSLQPDVILIEGPPDANDFMPFLVHPEMQPPIALLVYAPDEPKYAAYYPFAQFSPEYQAIHFALDNAIPVRFMDLPVAVAMHIRKEKEEEAKAKAEELAQKGENTEGEIKPDLPEAPESGEEPDAETRLRHDPLGTLAKAAGYQDGERWWEQMVEHRRDSTGLFEALLEAMTALREEGITSNHPMEDRREAYMRQIIRETQAEGFERIAVICGAWHSPALNHMPPDEADKDLLDGLERMKVDVTFTPWTHGRLTMWSGYGAGIWSPGWYQHLWEAAGKDVTVSWLTKCANLLRTEDLSASPAQVIDAVRLAESLASIRNRSMPGLEEFNEASLTVFCFGNSAPLRLIYDKLIVGETMGSVPDDTPMVPLQRDLINQQRALRLRPDPNESTLRLDLRETRHLQQSHLLHRLEILEIEWGKKAQIEKSGKGTYQEIWKLQWHPELTIQVIEKSSWGNTVYDAASDYSKHAANEAPDLPHLTYLVNDVLLADLPDAVGHVVRRLQAEAAATGDIKQLMAALPALADVMKYGNVRQTDVKMVAKVVDGMVTRTCIGLPAECAMLDDEAAQEMFNAMLRFNAALYLLNDDNYTKTWQRVLKQLMEQRGVHGLLRGRSCRILLDSGVISRDETVRQMRLVLNLVEDPSQAAAWLMGFLHNSGLILIHDDELLTIIDEWVISLKNEDFEALLPLLRRTFSTFNDPERRQIGLIISGRIEKAHEARESEIDKQRADGVLPILAELLGVDVQSDKDDA